MIAREEHFLNILLRMFVSCRIPYILLEKGWLEFTPTLIYCYSMSERIHLVGV